MCQILFCSLRNNDEQDKGDTVNKKVTSNSDKCPEPLNNPEEESGVATLDWAVRDGPLEAVRFEDLRTLN